jgi:hypothetical protein
MKKTKLQLLGFNRRIECRIRCGADYARFMSLGADQSRIRAPSRHGCIRQLADMREGKRYIGISQK